MMLDDYGFDLGFDPLLFDAGGFDLTSDLSGLDLSANLMDDLGLGGLDPLDMPGLDSMDFDLDFGAIGYGSDLEDVVLAPDVSDFVGMDLEGFSGLGVALDTSPAALADMSPADALGAAPLPSPFVATSMGGASVLAGSGARPLGMFGPPTDTFSFPDLPRGGRVAAKAAHKGAKWWKDVGGEAARDEGKVQVTKAAKLLLNMVRMATSSEEPA